MNEKEGEAKRQMYMDWFTQDPEYCCIVLENSDGRKDKNTRS